jgi:hypothetical protein
MSSSYYIMESSALAATELTYGQAKAIVAATIGNEGDASTQQHAAWALRNAIAKWNRRLQMEWNVLTHTDITVSAGTDTYDLPSDWLHAYSVRLTDNDRPLRYIEQRLYDKSFWDQTTQSYTAFYTLFGHAQTGKIKLIPMPSESDTLSIRYYKSIVNPSADDDKFAMPERYVWGLISYAKALVLMDRDSENSRIDRWLTEAELAFREARADDADHPDQDVRFVPSIEHGDRGYSEASAGYWLDRSY